MFFQKHIFSLLLFALVCSLTLTGCDNIFDFFEKTKGSEQTDSAVDKIAAASEGMMVLTQLLDEQQRLIEEVVFAKQTGNTELMKDSFNEVMRLEQQYQDGFDQYEHTMRRSEIREISNRHSDLVKNLPRL